MADYIATTGNVKKLTNTKKVFLLKKAKLRLERGSNNYICTAISDSNNNKIMASDVFKYIPELLKYKPKRIYRSNGTLSEWFANSVSGLQKRLNIITKTVKDIEGTGK